MSVAVRELRQRADFGGSAAADAWSFLATAAVLAATALAASALPARRAARLHPASALRAH